MSGNYNGLNAAWHQTNRADLAWSDEEIFLLSHIDETWHQDFRIPSRSIADTEMQCQRNMVIRGKRLWDYHRRVGDLEDFLVFPLHGSPGIGYLFANVA